MGVGPGAFGKRHANSALTGYQSLSLLSVRWTTRWRRGLRNRAFVAIDPWVHQCRSAPQSDRVRRGSRPASRLTQINDPSRCLHSMDRKPFAANMKLFANTRAQRNTAFAVLLVWLFALASGVANACLLEPPESHSKGSATTTSQAPAEVVGHWGTPTDHDDDSDKSRESCLKACDDGARSLTNAYPGIDQTDPGPAPLVAILWTGSPQLLSVSHQSDDQAKPIVGPPFRVRYSRLAL